ncbi:MAG: HEAT repeat domain-containing protein [Fuerstia sp.]|nr:HEAT repeat domain-containing protein [Fuerstiella sp.]
MRFSQPLVLLLGSVLSASGVGCSAITAVVSDSRPANRENRGDADRFAAIGRVFENQGRYDKAEAMYRKALRNRPQDPDIRNQLQLLAERRSEQQFDATGSADAIAMADIVSPPKSRVQQVRRQVSTPSEASPAAKSSELASSEESATEHLPSPTRVAEYEASPVEPIASVEADATPRIELTSGGNQGWRSSQQGAINSDDILVALERPDNHVEMLLEGLNSGDCVETKSLAATLLGDCDPANTQVRDALIQHQSIQADPEILIALCDSQIEREEATQQTVNSLLSLCSGFGSDIQIQAASQLRNFVGTEQESSCRTALNELLGSAEANVRATAAATLGDFASLEDSTLTRLQELADTDADPNVREAAQSALSRQTSDTPQVVPAPGLNSES